MKKIIIFAYYLGCGGTEMALVSLLRALDYSRYDVTLMLIDHDDFYESHIPSNVKIKYLKIKKEIIYMMIKRGISPFYKGIRKLYKIFNGLDKKNVWKFYEHIMKYAEEDKNSYDLALDFHGYGYFFTSYVVKTINAKVKAMWIHSEKMEGIEGIDVYLKDFDKIFCVSNSVKKNFDKRYPEFAKKSEVFYNIIDVNEMINKSQDFDPGFDGTKFNIVTVGRLSYQKGYDIAVETAKLLSENNIKFCWYFIGEGAERKKIEELIKKYKLETNVVLLGRKFNPYPYIKMCDLYVQPSRYEGYPIAIIEARALNKLIVASDIDSIKEQIYDNENGFIAELNARNFFEKIKFAAENKEKLGHIKQALKNERIDFTEEIRKLENLLE